LQQELDFTSCNYEYLQYTRLRSNTGSFEIPELKAYKCHPGNRQVYCLLAIGNMESYRQLNWHSGWTLFIHTLPMKIRRAKVTTGTWHVA